MKAQLNQLGEKTKSMKFLFKNGKRVHLLKKLLDIDSVINGKDAPSSRSAPNVISILVTNKSDAPALDVTLFDSYNATRNGHFSPNGDLLITPDISVSSSFSNINYFDTLQDLAVNPIHIGFVKLDMRAQSVDEVSCVSFVYVSKNVFGEEVRFTFDLIKDPYQYQPNMFQGKVGLYIDGFSKVVVKSLPAHSTSTFIFVQANKTSNDAGKDLWLAFVTALTIVFSVVSFGVGNILIKIKDAIVSKIKSIFNRRKK